MKLLVFIRCKTNIGGTSGRDFLSPAPPNSIWRGFRGTNGDALMDVFAILHVLHQS
jgi:hypothetical protein